MNYEYILENGILYIVYRDEAGNIVEVYSVKENYSDQKVDIDFMNMDIFDEDDDTLESKMYDGYECEYENNDDIDIYLTNNQCPYCEYQTELLYNLQKHIRIAHENVRYICPYIQCSYTASQQSALQEHISNTHDNIKCIYCDFKTSSNSYLKVHIKNVHKDQGNRYSCPYCDYQSKKKSHLTSHINSVHCARYKCPACDYTNKQRIHVENHIKKVHL